MERLKEMGQDAEREHEPQESTRVLAGYKATISSKSPSKSLPFLELDTFVRPSHLRRSQAPCSRSP